MKKSSLFLAFTAMLCLVGTVNAQLDATLNLTGIRARNIQVGAEFSVSEKFGIGLDVGVPIGRYDITVTSAGNATETSWKRTGIMGTVMAKYYFNPDQATTGLYGTVYSRFRNFTFKDRESNNVPDPSTDLKNTRVALGLGLGGKYLIGDKFVIDALAGAGFAPVRNNDLIDSFGDDLGFFDSLESVDLFVRLAVGYRILD